MDLVKASSSLDSSDEDRSEGDSSKEDSSKEDSFEEDSSDRGSSKENSSYQDSSKNDNSKEDSSDEDSSDEGSFEEKHEKKLDKLIKREKMQAFDAYAIANATCLERKANELILAIKKADERDFYGAFKDEYGGHFLGNVNIINQTELLKVAKKMPKGAHLHCHFNSCLRPEFLLIHARYKESMYIRSLCPLDSKERRQLAKISFLVQKEQPRGVNLFASDYKPFAWMKYTEFCEVFPGGLTKAEDWLTKKMRLDLEEVHNTYQTGTG